MLTGCYPPRIGFADFDGRAVLTPGQGLGLNSLEATIPKLLKEKGYASMLVGKWHCGDQAEFLPLQHGFDEYFGLPYSNDMGRQAIPNFTKEQYPLPLISQDEIIQQQPDLSALTE